MTPSLAALARAGTAAPAALDRLLAELEVDDGVFSAEQLAEFDRGEAVPEEACRALDRAGLPSYYVPAAHGGALVSFPELVELWRAIARRDLTVAVAHGKTLLGAITVWVAGSPAQARALGGEIQDGAVVAWGLTERGHGSDLLAGELVATRSATGWRLSGEKWLINNATRGQLICVLARTEPAGGPRGFSLFLVDKRRLMPGRYRCLAKQPTHGVRGLDLSGVSFDDAELPAEALVGQLGEGLEIVLRSLQLTRTACVGLSLGAGEHALRLAVGFAAQHRLYERTLLELPRARRTLGTAACALLIAEAVSAVATRAVHGLPGELSVISAITKALVPTLLDGAIGQLGELLGARAFLTEVYASGSFAKLERDHRIVAIFDGSTVVNRNALINQFPLLARAARAGRCDAAGLAVACDLAAELPALELGRLTLLASAGCSVLQALPAAVVAMQDRASSGAAPSALAELAAQLGEAARAMFAELAAARPAVRAVSAAAFAVAARYELCFAGAACLQLWLRNVDHVAPMQAPSAAVTTSAALWRDALWLEAALGWLLAQLAAPAKPSAGQAFDRLAEVVAAHPWPAPFSLHPAIATRGAR